MKYDFKELNENQLTAVEWDEGPLLVLAGPGSGKTRVLTMRVAKLLLDNPEKQFRILGLTFTNKAAAEMRTRVEEMVPEYSERALLTTFHSFCADILRQHGNHIKLKPDFTILNQETDREAILFDAIETLSSENADFDQNDIKLLPIIDKLMTNCIPESDVISAFREEEFGRKISLLFSEYQKKLIANNSLDFSSLLILVHKLLQTSPFITKQLRTIYPHVCVDEFQDTNFAQYQILKDLVENDPKNLFVVADDDQIIYQWNGASPERLLNLRKDFDMSIVQLPANYRCPKEVIVLANKLIRNNMERAADKEPLYAVKNSVGQDTTRVLNFNTMKDELEWVSNDIKEKHINETSECVILGRTRKLLDQAAQHLDNIGIEAVLAIRKTEFVSAPFRWIHAILRLANGRSDKEQLRRICKAFFELEGIDLQVRDIVADSSRYGGDLLKAWVEAALYRKELEEVTRNFLSDISKRIVDKLDFIGFIKFALDWIDKLEKNMSSVQEMVFVDYHEELATWKELQEQITGKYSLDEITLNIFLQELDLSEKSPPIPENAVRCFTIHSSKGLEFSHVYLIGLVEDQLPSFQSIRKGDKSREMQEERRNCFVAITRSLDTLTMTYANEYFGWPKKPSRFLYEMELIKKSTK